MVQQLGGFAMLLFQMTQVQFSVPIPGGSEVPVTPAAGNMTSASGL